MRLSPARPLDAFKFAAQRDSVRACERRDGAELDYILATRIECLGYPSAGYLRVFGEGQFHRAKYLFGKTVTGWAERYQSQQYSINDSVVTPSRAGFQQAEKPDDLSQGAIRKTNCSPRCSAYSNRKRLNRGPLCAATIPAGAAPKLGGSRAASSVPPTIGDKATSP
jgi:hypothetical protein